MPFRGFFFVGLIVSFGCSGVRTSAPSIAQAGVNESSSPPPLPPIPGVEAPAAQSYPEAPTAVLAFAAAEASLSDSDAREEAAAQPAAPPEPDRAPVLASRTKAELATDAVHVGPLLVYTASFLLSVYEVDETQAVLKRAVQELGGYVSAQTDAEITLRVPAPKFEQAVRAVETAGKVRARNVQSVNVGDQYRDLELRLRTAELLRARLEAMMARAERVPDALAVQTELERIVREIEQLKGQLQGLTDRVAYSTIVVAFRAEHRPDLDESSVFRLPFPWLDELGLHHLLELAP